MMVYISRRLVLLTLCFTALCRYTSMASDDDFTIQTENAEEQEVIYSSPPAPASAYLSEHFDNIPAFRERWILSGAKKDGVDENIAKYDGEWNVESLQKNSLTGDRGLVLKTSAKHAAISSRLSHPFHFIDKPLVLQYEVIFQNELTCGGAYIKLLSDSPDLKLEHFHDRTSYSIMFGPDKCGNEQKIHFIFRHRNPVTGEYEEKHAKRVGEKLDEVFTDKKPHHYRLVVWPDNTFQIYLDAKLVNSGSLLEDMTPPVNPAKQIDDPDDVKPDDWDERRQIPDPDAVKPEDWDEEAPAQVIDSSAEMPEGWLADQPATVPDASASKPSDWDEEMDGEWEPPMVDNPLCAEAPGCGPWSPPMVDNPVYKGKWVRPSIDNPNYRGKWSPRKIQNPAYFEDTRPFEMTSIGAVGFELWSMISDIYFDNILITDSLVDAQQFSDDTFALKLLNYGLKESTMWSRFLRYSSERPWLFAVYVVLIGLPVLLLLTYICTPTKKCVAGADRQKKATSSVREDVIPEETAQQLEVDDTAESSGYTEVDALLADSMQTASGDGVQDSGAIRRKTRPRRD